MPSVASARAGGGQRHDTHGHAHPRMPRRPGVDRVRVWGGRPVVSGSPPYRSPHDRQAAWQEESSMRQKGGAHTSGTR
jgi:hypothetical protein